MELKLTEEFERAYDLMCAPEENVFITGKAGTGKSTLLEYFRDRTDHNLAVLAPTGVAAVNVRGQTIHSFFGFGPDITVEQIKSGRVRPHDTQVYENLQTLVIDEISMVRADLLDCVDTFLRKFGPSPGEVFGGVKAIFIGDPFQLEPVCTADESEFFEEEYASPWFFDSHSFDELDCTMIELTTIHRQSDAEFIRILNGIRSRTITDDQLARLNEQVAPDYEPAAGAYSVYLTPTNKPARQINEDRLEQLDGTPESFTAEITGDFDLSRAPTQKTLQLKRDAQVMLLNNDPRGRWVNGTMGKVRELRPPEDEKPGVVVHLETDEVVRVEPFQWEMIEFDYDAAAGELVPETLGTFRQLPLRLSWAVTIHKSQGKTLENVILDTSKSGMFAHGQAYVALSRCTSLDGLVLKKPLRKKDVWMDYRVVNFFKEYHLNQTEEMDEEETVNHLERAIETGVDVEIVYVNSRGEKSRRTIGPRRVGKFSYMGNPYQGVEAYSHKHDELRQFSLNRIARVHPRPEQ